MGAAVVPQWGPGIGVGPVGGPRSDCGAGGEAFLRGGIVAFCGNSSPMPDRQRDRQFMSHDTPPPPLPHVPAAGQLGDVMKESASIAHTYARKFLEQQQQQQGPAPAAGAEAVGAAVDSAAAAPTAAAVPAAFRPAFFAEHAIHLHVPAGRWWIKGRC